MLPPNRDSSTSLGRPLPYTLSPNLFTPLESPAACSRDEDIIPFRANTGFNAPCEPPRWKVEDFLTGFTQGSQEGRNRLSIVCCPPFQKQWSPFDSRPC